MTIAPSPKPADASKVWASVVALIGSLAIGSASLYFIPRDTWEWAFSKGGHLFALIAADPTSATASVVAVLSFVAGVIAAARALLHTPPPASSSPPRPERVSKTGGFASVRLLAWIALSGFAFLAGCALLSGCGASALQTGAVGVTVALRASKAVDDVVQADLERRIGECPPSEGGDATADVHNVCAEHERAATADLNTALHSLDVAIQAVGAGIATATEIDAGQPIPDVVLGAVREVLALFDQVEAILRSRGVTIPAVVDMVVAALSGLLGPAS